MCAKGHAVCRGLEPRPSTLALQLFCQRHIISPKRVVISLGSYHMLGGRAVRISGEEALGTENTNTS